MANFILTSGLSVLFIILLLTFFYNIAFSVISFAPWVPTRARDLYRIFKLAALKDGQIFYDLGCGDGKVIFYAAKNFKVKAIGLEISLPMYLLCQIKRIILNKRNIKFKLKNLFKENLSKADVVYFFGLPDTINNKLILKLKKELKPGCKIISYSFKINGWTPAFVDKPAEKDLPIYVYTQNINNA